MAYWGQWTGLWFGLLFVCEWHYKTAYSADGAGPDCGVLVRQFGLGHVPSGPTSSALLGGPFVGLCGGTGSSGGVSKGRAPKAAFALCRGTGGRSGRGRSFLEAACRRQNDKG